MICSSAIFRAGAALAFLAFSAPVHACVPPLIDFEFGSARFGPDRHAELAYAVEEFHLARNGRVTLIAQSDGSYANLRMSRRRAQAIREALIRRGVPAGSISTEIRGVSDHVIAGGNAARRVVILVGSGSPTRPGRC